jgi:pilus assembly protein CpaE
MHTLVVSHDVLDPLCGKLRAMLRTLVDTQGPMAAAFGNAEQVVAQSPADLVVVVLAPDVEKGLEVLLKLRGRIAGHLLAVGPVSDSKLILRALQSGADHYLDETELDTELAAGLSRLKIKQEAQTPSGRLLALLSTSGGSGASTLAVNLATVLAKEQHKCALLDLNPGRGDLGSLLDLKPQFTLADLCLNVSRLDRAMFEKMLIRHDSGVHLLGAPQMFGDARVVTPQGVNQALTMARMVFPSVVADLEDCFHEEQVVTLRQATTLLLVTRLDFTSLRNARRILEHMQELDVPRTRIRLVVNRYGQPNELPVTEAEEALGEKLGHFIPDDPRTINAANNAGIPAVLRAPNAKVSQSIVQLARAALERRRNEPAVAMAST